jgi:uncharacterized membrane-anchored protein
MKVWTSVGFALALLGASASAQQTEQSAPAAPAVAVESAPAAEAAPSDAEKLAAEANAFYDSLTRRTGAISVVGGKVTLNVPETHYFVGPEDSERIIVGAWGNPPTEAANIEGMIFPKDGNPLLRTWGAVVEYKDEGHVTDDDAAKIDYAKLLSDMQRDTREASTTRAKEGFQTVELIGWAETPRYDSASKKLYWAKTLQFGGVPTQTLNYDIRALGRDGVLVISFIGGMDQLADIKAAAPAVLAMPTFAAGATYADYREGVDKKAAYGIAGLIAGGAAVALAKKAGLLAIALAFGKKFIVLIGVGIAALFSAVGRMFGKKPDA